METISNGNQIAPEGKVWVCMACGKMSKDHYGYQKINPSWDESCMLNSELLNESELIIKDGRVVRVVTLLPGCLV